MDASINDGQDDVREILRGIPSIYRELLYRPTIPPRTRLSALQDFMDRYGPVARKAHLNQTLTAACTPEDLSRARARIDRSNQKLLTEIKNIRRAIGSPEGGADAVEGQEEGIKISGGERRDGGGQRDSPFQGGGDQAAEGAVRERPRESPFGSKG